MIRNIYRYYSAISPVGDTWALTSNAFTEFCNYFKLVDARLPLKILDLVFITINSATAVDWRGNPRNPERGIIRFQFLEALIRLSDEKYIKNNLADNFTSALGILLTESIIPQAGEFDHDNWRSSRYFCEECDVLIKRYRGILEQVYKRSSKLKVKPGEKPFMSVDEFKQVCVRVDLASGKFEKTERDASICYNLAMMLQVDELESDRIFKMQSIEFFEAFARMCDIAMPPKLNTPEAEVTRALREKTTMGERLEWGLAQLLKLCSEELQNLYRDSFAQSMFPLPRD
jgi:hypothetical protein